MPGAAHGPARRMTLLPGVLRPDAASTAALLPDAAAATGRAPAACAALAYLSPVLRPTDIGISTSAYAELLLPAALESIAELASFAEIRSFGLHTLLSKRNRAEAQQAGLTYTVHGPFGYTRHLGPRRGGAAQGARRAPQAPGGERRDRGAPLRRPPGLAPRGRAARPRRGRPARPLVRDAASPGRTSSASRSSSRTCRAPGCRTSPTPATWTCAASASSSTWATPASAAASTSGWTTRARRCATCTCTTTTARATHDDPHLGLGAGVVDAAAVMAAARAAGASVVLEHGTGRRRADQPRPPAGARPALGRQRERLARLVGADLQLRIADPRAPGRWRSVHTMWSTSSKPNDGYMAAVYSKYES